MNIWIGVGDVRIKILNVFHLSTPFNLSPRLSEPKLNIGLKWNILKMFWNRSIVFQVMRYIELNLKRINIMFGKMTE